MATKKTQPKVTIDEEEARRMFDTSVLPSEGMTSSDVRKADVAEDEISKIFGCVKLVGTKQIYKSSQMNPLFMDQFMNIYRRCYQRTDVCVGEIGKFFARAFTLHVRGQKINWQSFVVKTKKNVTAKVEKEDEYESLFPHINVVGCVVDYSVINSLIAELDKQKDDLNVRVKSAASEMKEKRKLWNKCSYEVDVAKQQIEAAKARCEHSSVITFLSSMLVSKEKELLEATTAYKSMEEIHKGAEDEEHRLQLRLEKLKEIASSLNKMSGLQLNLPFLEHPKFSTVAFAKL